MQVFSASERLSGFVSLTRDNGDGQDLARLEVVAKAQEVEAHAV